MHAADAPTNLGHADLVNAIWAEAVRERPALFDGRVFVADSVSADRITGFWTRYRFLFAQLWQPGGFPPPHLRALAVNGLVRCDGGFVLGRRHADAVYRPGCLQAAPAGSVEARDGDAVLLEEQLLAELEEELGLVADEIKTISPVVAMEHPEGRVVDIGFVVTTALSFGAIETRWRERGNTEYDALRLVPLQDVTTFLHESGPDLLVSARILLDFVSGGVGVE